MENLNVDPWVWVVAAAVLALIIIGLIAKVGAGKKQDWDRSKAQSIRDEVDERVPELREREAATKESEAMAERARADAERLERDAREQRREVSEQRQELDDRLREADERDPDVDADYSPEHAEPSDRRD